MSKDRAVIYLALAQILCWAGLYYVFPAMLVRWEQSLGWSKTQLTGAITLAILISAVFSPLSGRLIDAGKGPTIMTAGAILGGVCLYGLSYVGQPIYFYIIWALIGVAMAGCLYEPCFALITYARGARAKPAIIVVTLIAGFAGSISFPGAHILSDAFGWRVTVRIFALVVIFLAAPLMWTGGRLMMRSLNADVVQDRSHNMADHSYLHTAVFWFLACGFSLAALLHGVALHHLLPILDDRGINPDVAVMAVAFIGPMQVAGRLAMMAAEPHVSNHGFAIACFITMGGSIVLLWGSSYAPLLLVGFVIVFGSGYGAVSIIRPLITRDILGESNFGAKSGSVALFYLAGSALAPYLGSLIWARGGYDLVLGVLVVLAAVGLGFYLAAYRIAGKGSDREIN